MIKFISSQADCTVKYCLYLFLSLSVFIFTSFWILLLFIAFDFKVGELSLGNKSILDMERMLHCFSNVLHPSHYILIDIMHNLVHLYAGKKILSRPEKERKIQLCFNVLDVLGNNEFTSKLSNLFIQNFYYDVNIIIIIHD